MQDICNKINAQYIESQTSMELKYRASEKTKAGYRVLN
jgi:hypothetical protein